MRYFCLVVIFISGIFAQQYQPNWQSLDSRPLPLWYDDSKFGIFTHWGVYSVPAYDSEWFWYDWKDTGNNTDINNFVYTHFDPNTTYADFARYFRAVDFDSSHFASVVKSSGAKYFVLTTKHHEGFTLWPSKDSWNWNAQDVGPARDLLGEIKAAIQRIGGLHFGTYFSLLDWYHPTFLSDGVNQTQNYVNSVVYPQIIDLVTNYQPEIFWVDGDLITKEQSSRNFSPAYWKSEEILAWIYNESPVKDTVVTNDRWGVDARCKHGGYYTCSDKYTPGKLQNHKWEDIDALDTKSWGYRRTMNLTDVLSVNEVVSRLAETISTGGNYLLNIAPDHNGRVLPIFGERLRDIGIFVNAHQEAIFATKPWIFQNDSSDGVVWYTSQLRNSTGLDPYRLYNPQQQDNTIIYAFVLQYPDDNLVKLYHVIPASKTTVNLFGSSGLIPLSYSTPASLNGGIQLDITGIGWTKFPSPAAFVLKIEYAADQNVVP